MDAGRDERSRHEERGAEISSGGWQLLGVGKVQVEFISCQDKRWGAGL